MTTEIFKIAMPRRTFVFVSARTNERSEHLGFALRSMGASAIGAQAFALSAELAPEAIRDALGELEDGECIHLIRTADGVLENYLLAPPRVEGGGVHP